MAYKSYHLENYRLEPKNHPSEKENHPNQTFVFGFLPVIFQGVASLKTVLYLKNGWLEDDGFRGTGELLVSGRVNGDTHQPHLLGCKSSPPWRNPPVWGGYVCFLKVFLAIFTAKSKVI